LVGAGANNARPTPSDARRFIFIYGATHDVGGRPSVTAAQSAAAAAADGASQLRGYRNHDDGIVATVTSCITTVIYRS